MVRYYVAPVGDVLVSVVLGMISMIIPQDCTWNGLAILVSTVPKLVAVDIVVCCWYSF